MLNDVIDKYNLAFHTLETSTNPKIQLYAIVNFFKFLEEKKQFRLFDKFIDDFLICIINIFKNSTLNFIDPEYLVISRFILKKAADKLDTGIVTNEILTAIDLINIRLLLLYYYLGETNNGLTVLKDILNSKSVVESGISLEQQNYFIRKFSINTSSIIDPNIFKINKAFDILRRINFEIKRINSYSDYSVNTLLVETDYTGINSGVIIALECDIGNNTNRGFENPIIENMTDIQEDGLHTIKEKLILTVRKILHIYDSRLNLNKYKIKLKYSDYKSIYKGISFGAGASAIISAQYLTVTNSRKRFKISNSAAFTGSVDAYGNLLKIPDESVEAKTEAAFFSWLKYIIIPCGNAEKAIKTIDNLHKKYPHKILNVIGINNIFEIFGNEELIKNEEDGLFLHAKNTIKRHRTISYLLFSFLLIFLTVIAVNKIIPKKNKPLPVTTQQLNMIYCPDRDTVWKFTTTDGAGGDTILFGETAIGDMWYQKLDLWNNDNDKAPLRVDIEGEDKDEFEVIWGIDLAQKDIPNLVAQDVKEKLFIKFVPFKKDIGERKGKLIFYNETNRNESKEIFLKGYSGFYKNGYSLCLKNDDEFIINPKGNVLQNEFTITYWFKPNKPDLFLLQSETSNWTQTKFNSRISADSILFFGIMNSKMAPYSNYSIESKTKVKLNDWNYFAVSHFNNITQLILNDEVIDFKTEDNHFLQIEDLFYFGEYHPIRRGTYDISKSTRELLISELRMYNNKLSANELFGKKYSKEDPNDKRLILYYDFCEASGKAVWDKTKNDIFAELYAIPGRSLECPPVKAASYKFYTEEFNDNYIKVNGKGQIILNKNYFKPKSDFTVQFEAKMTGDYKNDYRNISEIRYYESITYCWNIIHGDSISIGSNHPLKKNSDLAKIINPIDSNWHRYSIDYSYTKNKGRFFIDGKIMAEYDMGNYNYDFSKDIFFILFGNTWCYDNPRFIGKETCNDNISLFNRTLDSNEIKLINFNELKSIKGIIAFWSFNKIDNHICFDEINNYPIFLWDDFQIFKK